MSGEESATLSPEQRPYLRAIRLRYAQSVERRAGEKLETAFAVRRWQRLHPRLHLKEKHQPVAFPGVAVFADLQAQVAERLRAGRPAWPIVNLGKEKFEAQGQKNYKPTITVYGWLSDAGIAELAANLEADIDSLIRESEGGGAGVPATRRRRGVL